MSIPAWVLGGTSGIGQAIAEVLAEDGRSVYVTGADDCDVRDSDAIRIAYEKWEASEEAVNSYIEVVYSAGINKLQPIGEIEESDMFDTFDVNVYGFIRLIDMLRSLGRSNVRLVVIGSDAAERPLRTSINYCSSKAALHMAVRCAARETAAAGWRVNCIAPGMTEGTEMTKYIDETVPELRGWTEEETLRYEMQQAVIKRRATRYEIANMVYAILNAPDYLNGAIIPVNGGR